MYKIYRILTEDNVLSVILDYLCFWCYALHNNSTAHVNVGPEI
jgi:hypothetical protein